jgi:hypothetical protein
MTDLNALRSPLGFLRSKFQDIPNCDALEPKEVWWSNEGVETATRLAEKSITDAKVGLEGREKTSALCSAESMILFA